MFRTLLAGLVAISGISVASASQIRGEYLEARTCDVYTGPCFANAEMDLGGKEAVMAWKVDKGQWNDVQLDGLGVALVVTAERTIGDDGVFGLHPGRVRSVILVDQQASTKQKNALVAFVRKQAAPLAKEVVKVESVPFELNNDHLRGRGVFQAGKLAKIETRPIMDGDCVCTNEIVYYQPLVAAKDVIPAVSKTVSFQGKGLQNRWTTHNIRSAFMGTFRH